MQKSPSDTPPNRSNAIVITLLGLLVTLAGVAVIWALHSFFAKTPALSLLDWPFGLGGLLLLFIAAGVPLGAILLSAGAARLFPAAELPSKVLMPLLGLELVYFIYHAVAASVGLYATVPFWLFAVTGSALILLFIGLVWTWARKRPQLDAPGRYKADLQLGAGLSFFAAGWQVCGLAGPPGYAAYPDLVLSLANQSLNVGQIVATHFFFVVGFIFMLLAMREK